MDARFGSAQLPLLVRRGAKPRTVPRRQFADAEDAEHYVGTEWNEQRVFDRYDWLFSYDATARPEPVQT